MSMFTQSSFISSSDGLEIATYAWPTPQSPIGVVQIAHGMAEHGRRYDRLAQALTSAGFKVFASDHRGHGLSVSSSTPLGSFGPGGFTALIDDIAQFGEIIAGEYPGMPLFLVSHSMGSMAGQSVIQNSSQLYRGVVFSGTTELSGLARLAEEINAAKYGLAGFNEPFEHRTGYEWLSRDEVEVDAYVADPLCGFPMADDAFPLVLGTAEQTADPQRNARIRRSLSLLLASGVDDPIAEGGVLIEEVAARYRDSGISDVTVMLYPEARHEIFNETNRDEITSDVIAWLKDRS